MTTFDFYIDQKHTIWYRNQFSIDARSLDEAKAKVIAVCNSGIPGLTSDNWDIIYETAEEMSVVDNGGKVTQELYTDDGNIIWTNKPTKI